MYECPSSSLPSNIAAVAGPYSAIAGILAGFAFAAIILVIPGPFAETFQSGTDRTPEGQRQDYGQEFWEGRSR